MQVALDVLEPLHGIARRALELQHLDAALVLVAPERGGEVGLPLHVVRERDGTLHRELGARPDEVRRRRRVAEQDDVLMAPALAENPLKLSHADPRRWRALVIRRWPPRFLAKIRSQAATVCSVSIRSKPHCRQVWSEHSTMNVAVSASNW